MFKDETTPASEHTSLLAERIYRQERDRVMHIILDEAGRALMNGSRRLAYAYMCAAQDWLGTSEMSSPIDGV